MFSFELICSDTLQDGYAYTVSRTLHNISTPSTPQKLIITGPGEEGTFCCRLYHRRSSACIEHF